MTFAQARVLDQWPDGSARWALVDVRADLVDGKPQTFVLSAGPGSATALPPQTGRRHYRIV